ncbi:hypothetical protein AX15_001909 [Amanita polypyramis BW_CC]|nr:hypothetical protein AX15_001909 [Amanita polypyramis BW_CC]
MAVFSAGAIIWISVRPLIRLVICVLSGFIITKADIFPPVAARSTGQLLLNVGSPCLMFSKILPAFNSSNIHALGPLIMLAVIYELIGVIIAWVIAQFFWVPHRFRYGMLVAGGWSNVGDIPTSVLLSLTSSVPFNQNTDPDLSVAYISVFILVFSVSLFPCGGYKLIALDYNGPDVESEEIRKSMDLKRKALLRRLSVSKPKQHTVDTSDPELLSEKQVVDEKPVQSYSVDVPPQAHTQGDVAVATSLNEIEIEVVPYNVGSPTPTVIGGVDMRTITQLSSTPAPHLSKSIHWNDSISELENANAGRRTFFLRALLTIRTFIISLLNPPSLSILISFPIALVPALKALFIPLPSPHIPNAPDNKPPLAFILDAAQFIGAAAVPLGLICLGSALARLHIPRKGQWHSLPLGAISSLAVAKLIIMPILGTAIVGGMVSKGLIDREDKVLRLVCMLLSCLPTATTQVYLTQVYSGTGTAEHLSAFLILQYILMSVTMTTFTAYTIKALFG